MAKLYVVVDVLGTLGFDEGGNVLFYKPIASDMDEAVDQTLRFESGEAVPFVRELAEEARKGYEKVVVETEALLNSLRGLGITNVELAVDHELFKRVKAMLPSLFVQAKAVGSEEEYWDYKHRFCMELVRRQLRAFAKRRDLLAAQAIRAIDDLDKTFNLLAVRIREWYSVHFPELDQLVAVHEQYLRLVEELGSRENFTVEDMIRLGVSKEKAKVIEEKAQVSIGADISDFDIRPIQTLARMAREMRELRQELVRYIEAVMREVAPNVTALVGSLLGARLISLAGSLEELAKLPASTIQVLGAEKALFRALRYGGKPPKHGVIFQHPDVNRSPRWQRGKIARALAGKLAIAAKVDAFTGRYAGDRLVEEYKKRVEEVKKLYPKPMPKKEVTRPQPTRARGERKRGEREKGEKK